MSNDKLLVLVTDSIGRRWFHRSRWRTLTVGRADACEMILGSSRVSRRHLHLYKSGSGFLVTDLGSAAGTFVNGMRIEGRVEAESGAVIEAGPFLLEVFVEGEPPEEAEPWPYLGGLSLPSEPGRAPLADEEEALSYRQMISWAQVAHLPYSLAIALGARLLEEVMRQHAHGKLFHVVPPEWIWVGRSGAVAIRPEVPPELAASGNFDNYGSPELFDRPDTDVRSDVFACGLVLYELITAQHPFQGAGPRVGTLPLRGPFPDVRLVRQAVGREVAQTLLTSLEPCPDDRYSSTTAFLRALANAYEEDEGIAIPEDLETSLSRYFLNPAPKPKGSPVQLDGVGDADLVLNIEVSDPNAEGKDGEPDQSTRVSYPASGEILIGRHHTNDLVLLSLKLSRRHARFFFKDGVMMLEDLASANGTYVNGRRLRRPSPVAVGDRVEMGGLRLNLTLEPARGPHLFVVMQHGNHPPKRTAFHGRAKIGIGSDRDAEFQLTGTGVADRHARFIIWGNRLQIEDLGSGKETKVSGERIEGTRLLTSSEPVEIGPWRFTAALDEWPDATLVREKRPKALLPDVGEELTEFGLAGSATTAIRESDGIPRFRTRLVDASIDVDEAAFEAEVARQRSRKSPHLYPVVGGGRDDKGWFVDRPCLPGVALASCLRGPLSLDVWLALGEGMLAALRAELRAEGAGPRPRGFASRLEEKTVFVRADGRVLWLASTLAQIEEAGEAAESGEQQLAVWLIELADLLERNVDASWSSTTRKTCQSFLQGLRLDAQGSPSEATLSATAERAMQLQVALAPEATSPLLAVRSWLKGTSQQASPKSTGHGFDEVTAELEMAAVTEEGDPVGSDG